MRKLFPAKIYDPRPELPGSEEWVALLQAAKDWGTRNDDHFLYGHLLYFRLMGAELQESEEYGCVIRPVVEEWPGGQQQYDAAKQEYLKPYKQELTELVKRISEGVKA